MYKITPKEKINVNSSCIIDYDETLNASVDSNNKFKFRIIVPVGNKTI